MKLALLQTNLIWEDSEANLNHIEHHLGSITGDHEVIVLPEMFNTAFTMSVEPNAEGMDGKVVEWLKSKSTELDAAVCGSIIIKEGENFFNRFLWAEGGEVQSVYDKRHLFRMADEHHYFTAGKDQVRIEYQGWKIMPRICYDLRFPVWNRSSDIDLQIYVANWPSPRVSAWDKLLMARAIENQCYVIGVNRVGKDGAGKDYLGHSIVVDPKGNALTPESNQTEGWIYAEIDLESLNAYRAKFPLAMDADSFTIDD